MTKERTIEILKEVLNYVKIDRTEFSSKIGESSAQWIADILNVKKKVGISKDKAKKICATYPEINLSYLLTGEGEMLKSEIPATKETGITSKEKPSGKKVPVYDAETTGGAEGLVSSSTETADFVGYINSGSWFENKETAVIRHVGNSMTEFPDGCWLAVRRVLNPNLLVPGKSYVVETEEFRITKRIQKGSKKGYIKLYSTNKEKYDDGTLVHEPFEIHLSDVRRIFAVLGYVVNLTGEIQFIN